MCAYACARSKGCWGMLIGRLGRICYQRVRNFIFLSKKIPCTCFSSTDALFWWKWRVVLMKVTCRFEENNVLFCGKPRVVFLQLTCRFARKNSRCDFAGCYYGLITALYFQNQCVKRLSVFLGSNYAAALSKSMCKKEWIVTLRFLKYKLTLRWNLLLHLRCP